MIAANTTALSQPQSGSPSETAAAFPNPSSAIQVQVVTGSNYAALKRFLSTFPDETRGEEFWLRRFDLWWDGNPAFRDGIPRGWALLDNGAVSGFLGNVPTQVLLFGKPVTAFSTTTWRVLASHRNHSLRLFYEALSAAKDTILFDATPSDAAMRIIETLGFQLVPQPTMSRKSIIVNNPTNVLRSRMRSKMPTGMAVHLAGFGWGLFQELRMRLSAKADDIQVRCLARADSSFDDLWLRTQKRYRNTNVRSAAVINWQCFTDGDFGKFLFGCYSAGCLVGYVTAGARVRDGLRVLVCLDIWLDPEIPVALVKLLEYICTWSREREIDMVEVPHYHVSLAGQLKALGLIERDAAGEHLAYYKISESLALDATASFFVSLQGDRGL